MPTSLPRITTEFDRIADSIEQIKPMLSKQGLAIGETLKQRSILAKSQNMGEMIEQRREKPYFEKMIKTIPDERERELLQQSLDKLNDALENNSNKLVHYTQQIGTALVNKAIGKDDVYTKLQNLVVEAKDNVLGELPPVWKNLINFGTDFVKGRIERKERVLSDVKGNINEEVKTPLTTEEYNDEQRNETFSDVTNTPIENIDETTKNIENIVSKITDTEGNVDYQKVQEGLSEISNYSNEEMLSVIEDLHQDIKNTLVEGFSKLSENERQYALNNIDTNESIQRFIETQVERSGVSSEEEKISQIENIKTMIKDSIRESLEKFSDITQKKDKPTFDSFKDKEAEETYQRESVEALRDNAENTKNLLKFFASGMLGKSISSSISSSGGGLLGFASEVLQEGLGEALGAKLLKSKVGGVAKSMLGKAGSLASSVGGFAKNSIKSVGRVLLPSAGGIVASTGEDIASSILTDNVEKKVLSETGEATAKAGAKSVAKTGAKAAGKGILKSVLKKIPGVSLLAGLGFGASKLFSGDFTGALMEVASGAAGTVPGIGTVISTAIDAASTARDISKESEETNPAILSESEGKNFTQVNVPKEVNEEQHKATNVRDNQEIYDAYLAGGYERYLKSDNIHHVGKERLNERLEQGYGYIDGDLSKYGDHIIEKKSVNGKTYHTGFLSDEEQKAFIEDKMASDKYNYKMGNLADSSGRLYQAEDFVPAMLEKERQSLNADGSIKTTNQLWTDNGFEEKFQEIQNIKEADTKFLKDLETSSAIFDDEEIYPILKDDSLSDLEKTKKLKTLTLQNRFNNLIEDRELVWQSGRAKGEGSSILVERKEDASVPLSRGINLAHIKEDKTSELTKQSIPKKSSNIVKSTEEIKSPKKERELSYTSSSTRISELPKQQTEQQQTPTVINNVTNNNVTQAAPQQQKSPQMIINNINPDIWQGNGPGGGAR